MTSTTTSSSRTTVIQLFAAKSRKYPSNIKHQTSNVKHQQKLFQALSMLSKLCWASLQNHQSSLVSLHSQEAQKILLFLIRPFVRLSLESLKFHSLGTPEVCLSVCLSVCLYIIYSFVSTSPAYKAHRTALWLSLSFALHSFSTLFVFSARTLVMQHGSPQVPSNPHRIVSYCIVSFLKKLWNYGVMKTR